MAGASVAIVLAALTVLAIGHGLRSVIDHGIMAADSSMLDKSLLGLLSAILTLAAATFFRASLVAITAEKIGSALRRDAYANVMRQGPDFFDAVRGGDIMSRLTSDADALQTLIGSSLSVALRNSVMLIGGIGMMLVTSPRLSVLVGLLIPLVVLPIIVSGKMLKRLSRASLDRLADVASHAAETLGEARTVQTFCREGDETREFSRLSDAALDASRRRVIARAGLAAMVIILAFSGIGVILWAGGHDVLKGTLSAGQLSSFVFYSVLVAATAGAIGESWGDVHRAEAAAARIYELIDARPMVDAGDAPKNLDPLNSRGDLAFTDVSFSYPSRPETLALDGVSLAVKAGERVAVVGPSGAGKSTLFALAMRFYDPSSGVVSFGGRDLRSLHPHELRKRMAIVPQEPAIFSGDVWKNIGYGREGASQDEIIAAAKAANAHDFISALPQGYFSPLGERGTRLSVGQRQRIAIARAMLRDPAVLLLDEATSALDSESESLVQDALHRLMAGRATLVIAHRLSTVIDADRIVVMNNGRVDSMGAHAELMAENGLYARLASLQFGQSPSP